MARFEPDFIISWDISEKDNPTIVITSIDYEPKAKCIVGTVIDVIQAEGNGAISLNQLMARHNIQNLISRLKEQEGEEWKD